MEYLIGISIFQSKGSHELSGYVTKRPPHLPNSEATRCTTAHSLIVFFGFIHLFAYSSSAEVSFFVHTWQALQGLVYTLVGEYLDFVSDATYTLVNSSSILSFSSLLIGTTLSFSEMACIRSS